MVSVPSGSADGMFNLASVYLTGVGVEQSFQKAVLWYTQALDRGHTPAAYSLAIMHLNVSASYFVLLNDSEILSQKAECRLAFAIT